MDRCCGLGVQGLVLVLVWWLGLGLGLGWFRGYTRMGERDQGFSNSRAWSCEDIVKRSNQPWVKGGMFRGILHLERGAFLVNIFSPSLPSYYNQRNGNSITQSVP